MLGVVRTFQPVRGDDVDGFDAQIASICHTHDAALATRHLKDFQDTGIHVIDPWQAA